MTLTLEHDGLTDTHSYRTENGVIVPGGVWKCKIGKLGPATHVLDGSDFPMRQAITEAYIQLTGEEPAFCFSGWSAKLTEGELNCVKQG